MARCSGCSAPLPTNRLRCEYCGIRNALDLKAAQLRYSGEADYQCPECDIPLHKMKVDVGKPFELEHCQRCFGLFFDVGELERVLEVGTDNIGGVRHALIERINSDRHMAERKVRYRKCPVCREFMRRAGYAKRSGVVVDICRHHGVWLDNGELVHLLEWTKAGGRELQKEPAPDVPLEAFARTRPEKSVWRQADSSVDDVLQGLLGKVLDKLF